MFASGGMGTSRMGAKATFVAGITLKSTIKETASQNVRRHENSISMIKANKQAQGPKEDNKLYFKWNAFS